MGEEQKHTALGKRFRHHNKQQTKAALWRAELIKQNDYYRRMAIDSERKQAALKRGAGACFKYKDFWTTWNNDSFPVIGAGGDCPICHVKKKWKTVRSFLPTLGTKKVRTNLVNELTEGMKQQQQRKQQNMKAGWHPITTALSLLKATIGPSPFFFFLTEVDELVVADR